MDQASNHRPDLHPSGRPPLLKPPTTTALDSALTCGMDPQISPMLVGDLCQQIRHRAEERAGVKKKGKKQARPGQKDREKRRKAKEKRKKEINAIHITRHVVFAGQCQACFADHKPQSAPSGRKRMPSRVLRVVLLFSLSSCSSS